MEDGRVNGTKHSVEGSGRGRGGMRQNSMLVLSAAMAGACLLVVLLGRAAQQQQQQGVVLGSLMSEFSPYAGEYTHSLSL